MKPDKYVAIGDHVETVLSSGRIIGIEITTAKQCAEANQLILDDAGWRKSTETTGDNSNSKE